MQRKLKVVKALSHPVPLITFFLMFPIIPGRWDGIYLDYIFESIPGIKFYAFTAVGGIGALLYPLIRYKKKNYLDRVVLKAKCNGPGIIR
jgi:hypothetical protein